MTSTVHHYAYGTCNVKHSQETGKGERHNRHAWLSMYVLTNQHKSLSIASITQWQTLYTMCKYCYCRASTNTHLTLFNTFMGVRTTQINNLEYLGDLWSALHGYQGVMISVVGWFLFWDLIECPYFREDL